MKTLTEFIVKKHQKGYKYLPETKEELIENIKTELDAGKCNLNCIDTSKITNMSRLFDQKIGIRLTERQLQDLDVSQWNVSNVTDMWDMFYKCESFNQDLSAWNVSNVKDISGMFRSCTSFNQDLSHWNVSNVEDMQYMFRDCTSFNQDLSSWNVSKVKWMSDMFDNCSSLKNKPSWYR